MTRQLHDLLDSASVSQVPDGLADQAVAGARRRRRHRFELGAALALVVLLVAPVGWVTMRNSSDSEQLPAPVMSSVGLPAQLPDAMGLPMLADAPMDAASVVYLDAGLVVAIDAETGAGAYIYPNFPSPFTADYNFAERAYLSPDGQKVILTFGALLKPLLIDLSTGDRTTLRSVWQPGGETRLGRPAVEIAWAPSSRGFACICSLDEPGASSVLVLDLAQLQPNGSVTSREAWGFSADQLAWGDGGLATQTKEPLRLPGDSGHWVLRHGGSPAGPSDLGRADDLTLARGNAVNDEGTSVPYLAVHYPVGVAIDSVAECWIGWSGTAKVTGDSYRGSCDAVAVGATRDGFVMTMASGEVQVVGVVGQPQTVSQLPKGATSPSFAADLIGPEITHTLESNE